MNRTIRVTLVILAGVGYTAIAFAAWFTAMLVLFSHTGGAQPPAWASYDLAIFLQLVAILLYLYGRDAVKAL